MSESSTRESDVEEPIHISLSVPIKSPNVGDRVKIKEDLGTVRFVGTTAFATGHWIGVELDTPTGKNNGMVQGQFYFDCPTNHGVFVRASQIKLLMPSATDPSITHSSNAPKRNSSESLSKTSLEFPITDPDESNTEILPEMSETAMKLHDIHHSQKDTVPLNHYKELQTRLKLVEEKRAKDHEKLKEYDGMKQALKEYTQFHKDLEESFEESQCQLKAVKKKLEETMLSKESLQNQFDELQTRMTSLILAKEKLEGM
jgi:dynactin complex subunit